MDRIVIFKDEGGAWRWKKVAPNGERVAASGEAFDQFDNAHRAASREAEGTDAEVTVEADDG